MRGRGFQITPFEESKPFRFSLTPSCGLQFSHIQVVLAPLLIDPGCLPCRLVVLLPCGRHHMGSSLLTYVWLLRALGIKTTLSQESDLATDKESLQS